MPEEKTVGKVRTSSQASLRFSAAFLMKPRDKEGRKALFGFHLLVRSLAISQKKPCSDYGSNDVNIYLPNNLFYDRVSLSDTAKAEQTEQVQLNS